MVGLSLFFVLVGFVLFVIILLRLYIGAGFVLVLFLGVVFFRFLGVNGILDFFILVGVCVFLIGCFDEILFFFLVVVFGFIGVVKDFDRWGVWGLLIFCFVDILFSRRIGVFFNILFDLRGLFGVWGVFLLILGGVSVLIGWGRFLGLVNVGFDNALVLFIGFKLGLVVGILRG